MLRFSFVRAYLLVPAVRLSTPNFRRFIINWLPWKYLHNVRDIIDMMYDTSVEIFELKKKALVAGDEASAEQIGKGKDIMSILS